MARIATLTATALMTVSLVTVHLVAQEPPTAQQAFEAGQYEQALAAVTRLRASDHDPALAYLAGQIRLKLEQPESAREEFEALGRSHDATWASIGRSASALIDNAVDEALEQARSLASSDRFQAHYQLGLVHAKREDWQAAADAFERASRLDPAFAYAHYYAGLSFSRVKRADRTAEHFERFLKLAPRAPERAAVETMMRTLRGR